MAWQPTWKLAHFSQLRFVVDALCSPVRFAIQKRGAVQQMLIAPSWKCVATIPLRLAS